MTGTDCFAISVAALSLSALLVAVGLAVYRHKSAQIPLLLFVVLPCLVVGVGIGAANAAIVHSGIELVANFSSQQVQGNLAMELTSDTRPSMSGSSATAVVRDDAFQGVAVKVYFPERVEMVAGTGLVVTGRLKEPVPGGNSRSWTDGLSGTCSVSSYTLEEPHGFGPWITSVRKHAIEYLGGASSEHALVQALACGWRYGLLESSVYDSFKVTGLAHLVAVSGAHLTIVCGMFASLLKAVRVRRKVRLALLVATMALYFVLAGEPVSALRASVMTVIGLASFLGHRRSYTLNSIGIAAIALITIDPACCVSASFALSVLSTLGIVLLAPLFDYWVLSLPIEIPEVIRGPVVLTLSSSVTTMPLSAALFSYVPSLGLLANLLAAPLFPVACGCGLLAMVLEPLGIVSATALFLSHLCAKGLVTVASAMSVIPYCCIPVAIDFSIALLHSAAMVFLLIMVWTDLRLSMLLACFAGLAIAASANQVFFGYGDEIVMLDVGQGDAFLIRSEGKALLVDTGNQDGMLLSALARHGVYRLDAVLVTHGDDDHCGSLDALEQAVEVDHAILFNDMLLSLSDKNKELVAQAERAAHAVVGIECGSVIKVGAFECKVIWPERYTDDGGNADSICLSVQYDPDADDVIDAKALFTGDAETEQLEKIREAGALEDVDILKVGHHGSRNVLNDEQARLLSPEIALVSVGANNRYGHPTAETLAMLEAVGSDVYRTDLSGDVSCKLQRTSIRVVEQR